MIWKKVKKNKWSHIYFCENESSFFVLPISLMCYFYFYLPGSHETFLAEEIYSG